MANSWDQNMQSDWYNSGNWNTVDTGAPTGYEMPDPNAGPTDFSNFYGSGKNQAPSPYLQTQKQTSTASGYGGNIFYPDTTPAGNFGAVGGENYESIENEPPLLEELGVNFDHIRQKTMAVLNPLKQADPSAIQDNDLAGPLVFCLLFGASLLLHGKVHFGYIYGIGVLGCLGMYLLLNLMSTDGITITCTVSVIGYCLLPMGLLSLMTAVLSFKGIIGMSISVAAVLWCSLSASKLFVTALSMDSQRWLVAYPCSLLYGVFALLAIF